VIQSLAPQRLHEAFDMRRRIGRSVCHPESQEVSPCVPRTAEAAAGSGGIGGGAV
jgi:hypothetical protein